METMYQVAKTFGVKAPKEFLVEGFPDDGNPRVPSLDDGFVFRSDVLRNILAFLSAPRGDGLFLTGPTGAGKSSVITQVAARLNWPVEEVTLHGRIEMADLVGHHALVKGEMVFVYGPLARAMKEGAILLLNEIDLADPAELAGLNGALDGNPLVIPQNDGEVIRPHRKFRLVATGNSAGGGDQSGLYQGVNRQNLAFMDRFRLVGVEYPTPEVEASILAGKAPGLPEAIRESMIRVANEIRRVFIGAGDGRGELSVTMSTRTLVRWACLTLDFRGAPKPLKYALEQALLRRAAPEEAEAIDRIAAAVFGDDWNGAS